MYPKGSCDPLWKTSVNKMGVLIHQLPPTRRWSVSLPSASKSSVIPFLPRLEQKRPSEDRSRPPTATSCEKPYFRLHRNPVSLRSSVVKFSNGCHRALAHTH